MDTTRQRVIDSFRPNENYAWSHVYPFKYAGSIDGMAWVGCLCGAAMISGDRGIEDLTTAYLNVLVMSGEDSRAFAPVKVKDNWIISPTMPGYFIKRKPQAFAGPAAFYWALERGAKLNTDWVPRPHSTARWLCLIAPLFGYLIHWIKPLRQHINSVMFAHMLLGKRPPRSMHFLTKNNPFYAWLYRKKCDTQYPTDCGAWPAKIWPCGGYTSKGKQYSPVCQLAADLLQSTIKG